jgi:uncharacterized YccA/Bax inhibitor family protein
MDRGATVSFFGVPGDSGPVCTGDTPMPLFKTSNPALGSKTFQDAASSSGAIDAANRMTVNGTVNRTGILLICAFAAAAYTWHLFMQTHDASDVSGLLMVGVFGGFITAMVTIFKKEWAPITAPIYALLEGLFLGGISAFFDLRYPGIAIQAVGLTFGVLLTMLVVYSSGLVKVTDKLRIGIIAATGGIALFYLMEMILGFFHIQFVAINGSGPIGIAFSLFVCAIAALNLVLDFDFIEQGVNFGAPKYMEWYGAFGIMVTLVWLYLEILRLLSKLRSRN